MGSFAQFVLLSCEYPAHGESPPIRKQSEDRRRFEKVPYCPLSAQSPQTEFASRPRTFQKEIAIGVRLSNRDQIQSSCHCPATKHYDLWNVTDMVDGDGAGVMSVSFTVFPSALNVKVFSRVTLPSLL